MRISIYMGLSLVRARNSCVHDFPYWKKHCEVFVVVERGWCILFSHNAMSSHLFMRVERMLCFFFGGGLSATYLASVYLNLYLFFWPVPVLSDGFPIINYCDAHNNGLHNCWGSM